MLETSSSLRKVNFTNAQHDDFSRDLRRRVASYFQERGLSRHWNGEMALKSCFYLGGYLGLYAAAVMGGLTGVPLLLVWFLMGFFMSGIGFNVSHDAIHGAYSANSWVNKLMSLSFEICGANVYVWSTLHNVIHHSYTNIPEADGDLHPVPFLRFYPSEDGKRPYHRFQHIFAFALYPLTSLMWAFKKDFVHIFKKSHFIYQKRPAPRSEVLKLFAFKAIYYVLFLAIPMTFAAAPWWQSLLGFVLLHFACGFSLAIVFQLGHIVEGPVFPEMGADGIFNDSWHAHQLKTTANFAPNCPVVGWLCGGLNFQIEHHLFPRICHVHYKRLAPIVKQAALDHGLPYHEFPTFFSALKSHVRTLKRCGAAPA
jgi:linoleoyl-CoA desaturase